MIVAKTRLRKIPQSCNKCPFSRMDGAFNSSYRVCIFTETVCRKEKMLSTNWKYVRNADCPLSETLGNQKGGAKLRTPKEYLDNLQRKLITTDMLSDCIFSSNKRAKNWRDKQREYSERRMSSRHFHDKYNNEGKAKREKEKYYRQKDLLLSVLQPVSIHRVQRGYERRRIYDYEKAYRKFKRNGLFVWENCFYDHDYCCTIWFGDIELKDKPIFENFLFYKLGKHSFHTPIPEKNLKNYELPVIDLEELETHGLATELLLSNQFVFKVANLISSNDYTLVI